MIPSQFLSKSKQRGTTAAGIFGAVLASMLPLCGAGSVPIENFSPQGSMQADLNAGGHNITNAGTITGASVVATGLGANLVVPVANGGTGTSTPALVAGANVTITGAFPNQTINATGGGGGSVTTFSETNNAAPLFTVNLATPTTAPALTFSLPNAAPNSVWAGPASGGAGAPTYRALVPSDLPNLSSVYEPFSAILSTLAGSDPFTAGSNITISGTWPNVTISSSGGGSASLPTATTELGNTLNTYGQIQAGSVPAGSVVVIMGDSIQVANQGPYTSYPAATLSAQPQFANVPVYVYAISGTTAGPSASTTNSGLAILAASAPAYVKFLNGAEVATGTAKISSLYPSSGKMYVFPAYGANDARGVNGETLASFEASMSSLYSTLHGYGTNVVVVGSSITDEQLSFTIIPPSPSKTTMQLFNGWIDGQVAVLEGGGPTYSDLFCDLNSFFTTLTNGAATGDIWSPEGVHLTPIGYKMMGIKEANTITQGITTPTSLGMETGNPLEITGRSLDGTFDTGGVDLFLSHNSAGNRQLLLIGTDALAGTAGEAGLVVIPNAGEVYLAGETMAGGYAPLQIGNTGFATTLVGNSIVLSGPTTASSLVGPTVLSAPNTASSFAWQSLDPTLATGNTVYSVFGTAQSNGNASVLGFNNLGGAGSASNTGVLGIYGGALIAFDASGDWSAPGLIKGAGYTDTLSADQNAIVYKNASGQEKPVVVGAGITFNATTGTLAASSTTAPIVSIHTQVFTSSGTYTPSAGLLYAKVQVQAGGGGGGSSIGGIAPSASAGGGGGGGSYVEKTFTATAVGASQTVTVGAGGTGVNAAYPANGGTGGTSSFGSLLSAAGGYGGVYDTAGSGNTVGGNPGAGGPMSSGGDINIPGSPGISSVKLGASSICYQGAGGGARLGPGELSIWGNVAGTTPLGYGGGASGGGSTTTSEPGGAGAPGEVIITEYCSQ